MEVLQHALYSNTIVNMVSCVVIRLLKVGSELYSEPRVGGVVPGLSEMD
jgi:hypothetical protein